MARESDPWNPLVHALWLTGDLSTKVYKKILANELSSTELHELLSNKVPKNAGIIDTQPGKGAKHKGTTGKKKKKKK
ncbi:hypothetical protein ABZ345_18565 [Lentzea sp. NPDC005914]|uniref:hypothetical protein n=1 Tax=Lentzea sp. NPDC005914 TaxID=3154572 RepID=UPI0033FE907D